MNKEVKDLTIIGGGPIGLWSVFQAHSLGMSCHLIETLNILGGQCSNLYPDKYIYDIPGHVKITARELINNLESQIEKANCSYLLGQRAVSFDKIGDIFHIKTSQGKTLYSKAILITAGKGSLEPNRLHLANSLENQRVFYSIKNIDKFKNKRLAIAGGGDSAVDWGLILSEFSSVSFIHRRDKFKALPSSVSELEKKFQAGEVKKFIPFCIKNVKLDKSYTNSLDNFDYFLDFSLDSSSILIELENISTSEVSEIEVDYLLLFYGLNKDLMEIKNWNLDMIETNLLVNPNTMSTNIEGIYAAGDIVYYENKLDLILTGFSETSIACNSIYKYIHKTSPKRQYSTSNPIFI